MIESKLLSKDLVRSYLPNRKSQSHKGSYGRLDCVAGSKAYFGAGLLALASDVSANIGRAILDLLAD